MINPALSCKDLSLCLIATTNDCNSVLELGCCFGDKIALARGNRLVGVDIWPVYIEAAKRRWIDDDRLTFICQEAVEYASTCNEKFDAILMIDFIEHLYKEQAQQLLKLCSRIARRRIIIFVPEGEHHQDKDIYGMGADVPQTHKSFWEAEDFEQLGYSVLTWLDYHGENSSVMFAIWEPPCLNFGQKST